jgi:hypothetical protein
MRPWGISNECFAPAIQFGIIVVGGVAVEQRATGHLEAVAVFTECLEPMPEICRFLGIVIRMYYRDHLPPHFHAEYGEHEITVEIDSGIVEGRFPRRALTAVLDWYSLRRDELARNWELVQARQPLNPIEPLE